MTLNTLKASEIETNETVRRIADEFKINQFGERFAEVLIFFRYAQTKSKKPFLNRFLKKYTEKVSFSG